MGIKKEAKLSTNSPFEVSPSATRVYPPNGNVWVETEGHGVPIGGITFGSSSPQMSGSYGGLTVEAKSESRATVSWNGGTLRMGTDVRMPFTTQWRDEPSVSVKPYFRISTNVYGQRAATMALIAGGAYFGSMAMAGAAAAGDQIIQNVPVGP